MNQAAQKLSNETLAKVNQIDMSDIRNTILTLPLDVEITRKICNTIASRIDKLQELYKKRDITHDREY